MQNSRERDDTRAQHYCESAGGWRSRYVSPSTSYLGFEAVTSSGCLIVLASGCLHLVVSELDDLGLANGLFSRSSSFFPFILNENYNHNHEKQDIGVRQKRTHTSDENAREHEEDIGPR